MSPLGTPEAIEKTLNKAIDLAILSPEVQTQFKTLGIDSTYLNNKDFLAYIKIENDKWAKVIKSSNIKLY